MMSVYLHDIPLVEAQRRLELALEQAGLVGILGTEEIPLNEDAWGRVLAAPVWAKISSPHYNASAMDGFAVRAVDTIGALPASPRRLSCGHGGLPLQASYIDTGDPIPEWADAVIPIELTEALDRDGKITADVRQPAFIQLRGAISPWKNIRPLGEDMAAGQLVLPAGQMLRPVDLGAIAASGNSTVTVSRRPGVAIIPTGSELRPIGQPVDAGEIIEFNSLVLASQVKSWGGSATRFPITPDHFDTICQVVQQAAQEHDLILLNAGSSAGSEDFSARVITALGEVLVHGVAARPGHPVIIGMIDPARQKPYSTTATGNLPELPQRRVPIIGVPGFPVSAALTGEIFVEPMIRRWSGYPPAEPNIVQATVTRKIVSPPGDDDYRRVALGMVGDRLLAAPLPTGAGVISSLVQADGILIIPSGSQGIEAGEPVKVRLYRALAELSRTILAIGSHDMLLDLVAQYLAPKQRRLVSANVGSLAGLIALRRGEAHLAGCHLLDEETGEYNLVYIRQYLPGIALKLVLLAMRQQGLMVRRGNPKKIVSLEDLAQPGVRMVNRQQGAGTRVLLDYHLKKLKLSPDAINGYDQEEYTHLAVATAIASGRADTGLGIAAAAQALDLDFIALFEEPYELAIPTEVYQGELVKPLLDILNEPVFQAAAAQIPGYDVSQMGKVIADISG
jgi:putative molybdopterin biosynthesis protein